MARSPCTTGANADFEHLSRTAWDLRVAGAPPISSRLWSPVSMFTKKRVRCSCSMRKFGRRPPVPSKELPLPQRGSDPRPSSHPPVCKGTIHVRPRHLREAATDRGQSGAREPRRHFPISRTQKMSKPNSPAFLALWHAGFCGLATAKHPGRVSGAGVFCIVGCGDTETTEN